MVFWGALGSLTQGTTALLFRNRADNFCPGWCDFSGAVQYVYPVGFLAGSLRLLMKLESIASTRQVSQSHADRRHTLVLDIALGLGLPLLMVPLRLVVQGHRMDIVEGFECEPPIYPSIAAVLLYQIWPLVLDLCCLGYALATIRWFLLRRRQFAAVVASSDSGLNFNKYLRLLVMSGLQVVVWTPVSIYLFVRNQTTLPHKPYDSWNSVHRHFDMTYSYTKSSGLLTPALLEDLEMGRWVGVCGALVLFLFLGTNIESMNEYRRWASVVASPFSTRSRAAAKTAVGNPVVRRHASSVQGPAEEEEGQTSKKHIESFSMPTLDQAYLTNTVPLTPITPSASADGDDKAWPGATGRFDSFRRPANEVRHHEYGRDSSRGQRQETVDGIFLELGIPSDTVIVHTERVIQR